MYFSKQLIFSLFAAVTAIGASAQFLHTPSGHEKQHNDLLANQAPLMEQFKVTNTRNLLQDVESRENAEEIFGMCWDTQSVNPYSSIKVPDTKNIELGEYVHPFRGKVSSEFGWRPRFGRMHKGIDLSLHVGDTIVSAFSGVVRVARYNPGGYGNFVIVRHDNGLETVYGHLKRSIVKPGQKVKAGQIIGLGGNTGRSTGPHLHFETRYMGVPINPRAIIDFENYTTHKDVYAFDRQSAEKAVNYAPRKGSRGKASLAKKKSSKSRATASARSKKRSKKK